MECQQGFERCSSVTWVPVFQDWTCAEQLNSNPRNTVHEGHGVSKALLEELQKDIAAMRTDTGTEFMVKVCLVDVVSIFSSLCCLVDFIIITVMTV